MKNRNNAMKQLFTTSALALMGFVANGQLLETMGTAGSGTQTISAREAAGSFDLVNLTYTGTADMRTTSPSTGYPGASGSFNTLIQALETFEIQGINAGTCKVTDSIHFGVFKSTNASTGIDFLTLEYSNDNGASWSPITFPALPTGTGTSKWYKVGGALPAGALVPNLRIRFRSTLVGTSTSNPQFRVDDISMTCGSTSACGTETADITVTGSTVLCAGSALPQLTANSSIDEPYYQWYNQNGPIAGAQTDVYAPTGSGTYYVVVSSEAGCEATSEKEYVLVYPQAQFCKPADIVGCAGDIVQSCVKVNAKDLIISQYVEGSGFNKYIEIFNGTCNDIDLSNYVLNAYHNGADDTGLPTYPIALSGTLVAGDVYVIAHDSATVWTGIPDLYTKNLQFNGDDALVLYKLTAPVGPVDIFGSIGNDPGTAWRDTLSTSSTNNYRTENVTLVRKPCVYSGITVNPDLAGIYGFPTLLTEWDTLTTDDVTGLGSHTMGAATYNFSVTSGNAVVTPGTGNCRNIQIGTQNSVITVTGTFCGVNNCGGSTTFAVNLDPNCPKSGITTSAVEGSNIALYPNPTNGSALLTFTTNSDENVSVVLFDISGKQRIVLSEGFLAKGTHRLEADLSKLAAGTYLIKITSATESNTLRVIKTDK